jgi:hypothetical protein
MPKRHPIVDNPRTPDTPKVGKNEREESRNRDGRVDWGKVDIQLRELVRRDARGQGRCSSYRRFQGVVDCNCEGLEARTRICEVSEAVERRAGELCGTYRAQAEGLDVRPCVRQRAHRIIVKVKSSWTPGWIWM